MTSRERMEAAIHGNSPDSIPVVIPYFHLYLDHIAHELPDLSWAHRMYGTPEQKAEIYRLARTYFELDWLPVGGIGTSLLNVTRKLAEKDGNLFLLDTANGKMSRLPQKKPVDEPITKRRFSGLDDDALKNLPPVLEPDEIISTGVLDAANLLVDEYSSTVMVTSGASLPGNQNYFYLGIYDMMTALKLEPELVHFLVDRSRRMIINLLLAMSRVGITCVWLEDNFVGGDLISREDYETFFHKPNTEIIEEAKRAGLYTIYYLTGDVMPRIPHILDMNPDCLAFEESKKTFTVDPVRIRQAVGDNICLLGNIDVYADIERGDKAVWERSIHHQLKAACPHGKFILSVGSPITHDTPKEKVRDFVRFARNFEL